MKLWLDVKHESKTTCSFTTTTRTRLLDNILLTRFSSNNQISTYYQVMLLPFWETVPHWYQHWNCSVPLLLQSLGRVLAEEDGSAAASLWTASSVYARRWCKRECEWRGWGDMHVVLKHNHLPLRTIWGISPPVHGALLHTSCCLSAWWCWPHHPF